MNTAVVDIESWVTGRIASGEFVIYAVSINGHSVYASCPARMSLVLEEQPVHGCRYYTVKPSGHWAAMEEWALNTFGEVGDMWDTECHRWYMNNSKFWFRNKKDLEWFVLRWS